MKKYLRVVTVLILCLGMATACQKESVDNSELLRIQQQNDELHDLIIQLQYRTDSIANALKASQQQQANMQAALDSVNKKLDSVLAKIEKINLDLLQVNTDLTVLRQQLVVLTQQYQQLLAMLNDLESRSCTINSGLLAWYPFSGNVLDSSGKRYDGTIINSVPYTTDRNDQPNSAIFLNGVNGNYITTTVPFNFQRGDAFSVSFWFTDAGTTAAGRLLSTENPEGNFRTGTYRNGIYAFQFAEFYVYDTVAINTWNHMVYTYANRSIKVYKNGELKVTATDTGDDLFTYTSNFTIGAKASSVNDTWYGKLDELRIYNRVLTDAEVKRLFEQ
mgnify:CR=1 FL=1